jgi:uncharacterized protein YicC (UPF0701 family)
VTEYRQKLTARMQEVLQTAGVDEQRILTEAAIYADKIAVDEETVRLRSHVAQLRDHAPGRRAHGPEDGLPHPGGQPGVQHHRLQVQRSDHRPSGGGLKAEVEKIREQVQNIE